MHVASAFFKFIYCVQNALHGGNLNFISEGQNSQSVISRCKPLISFFFHFSWVTYRAVIMQLRGQWMPLKNMWTQKNSLNNSNIILLFSDEDCFFNSSPKFWTMILFSCVFTSVLSRGKPMSRPRANNG